MTDKFWVVWKSGGNTPTKRHLTREAALEEAQRLATANLGSTFFVLSTEYEVGPVQPQIMIQSTLEAQN